MTTQLGGGKAVVGGYWGAVVKDPAMCHLYWNGEWWMMWWMNGDAMPLEDFCALDEMNAFQLQMVMDDLSALWWFCSHGGGCLCLVRAVFDLLACVIVVTIIIIIIFFFFCHHFCCLPLMFQTLFWCFLFLSLTFLCLSSKILPPSNESQ